jgi:hypothetical protein
MTKTDPDAAASEMTKREEMAKSILAGMFADTNNTGNWDIMAEEAVKAADALITELNK